MDAGDELALDAMDPKDTDSGDPPGLVRVPGYPPTVSPVDDPVLRGFDGPSFGWGSYGERRDNGGRKHLGIDVETVPGQPVRSIVGGKITLFDPYGRDPAKAGKLSAVQTVTDPDPQNGNQQHTVRQMYIDTTGLKNGKHVEPGQVLGPAQDLSTAYPPIGEWHMTNHTHSTCSPARPISGVGPSSTSIRRGCSKRGRNSKAAETVRISTFTRRTKKASGVDAVVATANR
jgi:hypothetical protein